MTAAKPRPCQFGCDTDADWMMLAADPDAPKVDACTLHLADARVVVTANLPPGTPLLIRRAPRRPSVRPCEWLEPLNHAPWIEKCPRPGAFVDTFEQAKIRHCGGHKVNA